MAGTPDISQRFALDTQGFEALRQGARAGVDGRTLQVAARQFEAVFTQMVLKSMRDATPKDGLFDSEQGKLYMSMLDQQMAQHLSSRGIGLADVMVRQLARAAGVPWPETAAGADTARTAQAMTDPASDLPPLDSVVPGMQWNPEAGVRDYRAQAQAAPSDGDDAGEAPAHVAGFVARMTGPAQAASAASGVPARLIVGQAALESGWGRREILHADGSPSYNVFGIKAGAGWNGRVAEVTTTEYVDGQPQKVKARFRAYGSYEEACHDYARLLAGNRRYAEVLAAGSPEEAAHRLQRAGYATDPAYGEKLVRVMRRVAV